MKKHIVTGPVAVAEFAGGASRYLYKGAILPEGCTNLALEYVAKYSPKITRR